MLIISSLRYSSDGNPPTLPASHVKPPLALLATMPSSPVSSSSLVRCTSASMRPEPQWESAIRGSSRPDAKCKKLMHLRSEGISKITHKGIVTRPAGRPFVTPSELNLLKERRQRCHCDIKVAVCKVNEASAPISTAQSILRPIERLGARLCASPSLSSQHTRIKAPKMQNNMSKCSHDIFDDEI